MYKKIGHPLNFQKSWKILENFEFLFFSSMLDRFLTERGLKRDPRLGSGCFIVGELWEYEMKKKLSGLLNKNHRGGDPPEVV